MKQKLILHIPTGLYFNHAFYPAKEECHIVLTKQFFHRNDDTDILKRIKRSTYKLYVAEHDDEEVFPYRVSASEFTIVKLELEDI